MNWQPIETVEPATLIRLRFKHEIGEYELADPCVLLGGKFYRCIENAWRKHLTDRFVRKALIKLHPSEWAPYAPA